MFVRFKKYVNSLYPVILIGAIFVAYWGIFSGFFQQDEWFVFGEIFGGALNIKEIFLNLFLPGIRHFNPLTDLLTVLGFYAFKLNYGYWAASSILMHIITTILVFKLAEILFKKRSLAFIASLIFALSAGHYQATTWVVVNIATQAAAIFGILSLILFVNFLGARSVKTRNLYFIFSLSALVISLLFKEVTIALFLFLPLMFKLFSDVKFKNAGTYKRIIFAFAVFYVVVRALPFLAGAAESKNTFVSIGRPKTTILINFLTLPATSLVQSVVPVEALISISEKLSSFFPPVLRGEPGTTQNDIFTHKRVLVVLSFIVFLVISVFIFFLRGKNLIFGYLFVVLNSFIFLISPERIGIMSVADSRNLYFLSVGSSLIIAAFAEYLLRKKRLVGGILIFIILAVNSFFLIRKIYSLSEVGLVRRGILFDINSNYPTLPKKTIFYIQSDSSYYGLPESERILPFQSGFGQTLLVWYYLREGFPREFFQDKFLWEIINQGYKEAGSRGFGYFRDFNLMAKTVTQKNIPTDSVIGFRYDSSSGKIEDISLEIRGRLTGYASQKREISMNRVNISSSLNSKAINLVRDGRRETFWSSMMPYIYRQYIEIVLDREVKIAQIQIDSYNSKDQDRVGYRVSLFGEDGSWHEVFYAKRYPPDGNGLVDLYFEPQSARSIKIDQVGSHSFAPWIIHEINLYEAIR